MTTFAELEHYAEKQCHFPGNSVVPTTRARARCWLKNPEAEPSDPALVTFVSEVDGVIGYIGLMPTKIYLEGTPHKVFWASTGFSAPLYRDGSIGKATANFVLDSGILFCSTGNSFAADHMYRKNGFFEFSGVNGFLFPLRRLSVKYIFGKILRRSPKPRNDRTYSRDGFTPRISTWILRIFGFEITPQKLGLSEDAKQLFSLRPENGPFRSPEVIDWMLTTPWWPPQPELNDIELHYAFNWDKKEIFFKSFDISRRNGSAIVASFAISFVKDPNIKIKILDFAIKHKFLSNFIFLASLELALKVGAEYLYVPIEIAKECIFSKIHLLLFREHKATYFALSKHKETIEKIMSIPRSLTDGDTSFW